MDSQKKLGEYSIGDKVCILGSKGVVIDIIENENMILIESSRGLTKVSPNASSTTLKKLSIETPEKTLDTSSVSYCSYLEKDNYRTDSVSSPPSIEKEKHSLSKIDNESDTHYSDRKKNILGQSKERLTNKYVCVIKIDDGRIYVDYHFETGNRPFGEGRVFNRIYIDGVTTLKGKQIPGSTNKLKLIAFYPCETIDEIKKVFEEVFNEYKEKYPELVFRNKKLLSEEQKSQKSQKQKKHREMKIQEGASFQVASLEKFYNIMCQSEAVDYSEYLSKTNFSDLYNVLKRDSSKNRSNLSFEAKYYLKESIIIDRFNIDMSYSNTGVCYRVHMYMTKILEDGGRWNDDQVFFSNEKGDIFAIAVQWTNNSTHTRIQFILPHVGDYYNIGSKVFSSNKVSLILKGLSYPLLEQQRKMFLHSFWIMKAYYLQFQKKYDYASRMWLNRKLFNSLEMHRFEQSKEVRFVSVDRQNESAIIDSYREFRTTLHDCTCPHFQDKDSPFFCPCEHMFALALELKKCDRHPKLNLALDDEIRPFDTLERTMFLGSNKEKSNHSCISRYYNKSLKLKFIRITTTDSILYLGQYPGYIEDEDLDYPEKYYCVMLNDKIVGSIYKEEEKKRYYHDEDDDDYYDDDEEDIDDNYRLSFSPEANDAILLELANKTNCEVLIKESEKEIKRIKIQDAFGVATLYCTMYYPKGTIWKEESEY